MIVHRNKHTSLRKRLLRKLVKREERAGWSHSHSSCTLSAFFSHTSGERTSGRASAIRIFYTVLQNIHTWTSREVDGANQDCRRSCSFGTAQRSPLAVSARGLSRDRSAVVLSQTCPSLRHRSGDRGSETQAQSPRSLCRQDRPASRRPRASPGDGGPCRIA